MNKSHPKHERTLIIVKPDGIQRSLIGEIISRYENVGLKLMAMKMMVPTAELIEKHYTLDPDWRRVTGEKTIKGYKDKGLVPPTEDPLEVTRILLGRLVTYMTSGPVISMVWEGAHAVAIVRKLTGGTEPLTSDVGTIRGDFVLDSYAMSDQDSRSVRNLVHASGSAKEAEDEIRHWFSASEIMNYRHIQEKILYDFNLDGSQE
ncbi:MAG: nucleoside-diphosphate kinase [Patescibacteria group bacterium]